MTSYAAYLAETMVTLVLVCAVMYGVLYGAKRLGVGRPKGPIQLLGQLPLDGRRAVYLVRVAEQVLVVGASEGGLTRLGELTRAELEGHGAEPPAEKSFAELLRGARKGKRSGTAAEQEGKELVAEAKDPGGES
jgi:flagellar biogenesis protein FliO